jgi:hypothetical protein
MPMVHHGGVRIGMREERTAAGATAVSIVRKVGVVAVLVAGCHKSRACDALPQLAISPVRATDAEYMPGYPTEGVMSDASEFPSRGGIAHSQYYALRALREHGEPPLARLAGKGGCCPMFVRAWLDETHGRGSHASYARRGDPLRAEHGPL